MQTNISEYYKTIPEYNIADKILRSCVHCGFCTATCPTYQLLGNELDSPRGRIYLIKQLLEGAKVTRKTQLHLDRCLTCRACETICPSGVEYGHLLDIGRKYVDAKIKRSIIDRIKRFALINILPYPIRFGILFKLTSYINFLLPSHLKTTASAKIKKTKSQLNLSRKMILVAGCVQPTLAPQINNATINLLNKLDIEVITIAKSLCCGAVTHHLSQENSTLTTIKKNIDLWWPQIQSGVEAIIVNASGCTVMVKDYGVILLNDSHYSEKAAKVSLLCKDISEVLQDTNLSKFKNNNHRRVAFHPPCTLQHGMKLNGVVENILESAGYQLTKIKDNHLCCGSSGTYSILQSKLSNRLAQNKVDNIEVDFPELVVTANIGCLHHLRSKMNVPVKHWLELFYDIE
ncbi:Glycolate dehydrogenase, iron-sulfur subunit GlcF [hydrothermal vent metagenome]|uniref:Glycolate dehydrogenase, iron-sulfur subunit GlcF n=1 Tax=hydrothermal vent metagenome TaxID=652676 RepID=A0A3B1AFW5_9ZZZZ